MLHYMMGQLGFPKGGLVIEKALSQLPHLQQRDQNPPLRRVDLMSYAPGIHPDFPLYPLLLVECKAIELSEKVLQQAAGYNHFIGAPFICIANDLQRFTGWYDPKSSQYRFMNSLPSYKALLEAIQSSKY